MNNAVKNKLLFGTVGTLIVLLACFGIISLFSSKETFSQSTADVWDGVSVADSFSFGNGTIENPYLITNSSEFIYFKKLIDEDVDNVYEDSYFKLTTNIDLSNNYITPIGEGNNIFTGLLDGDGYGIYNAKIVEGSVVGDYSYYGLFSKIEDGSIRNLNISNFVVSPSENEEKVKIGILAGEIVTTDMADILNVSISDSKLDLSNTVENSNNNIGGLVGYISEDVVVDNVFLEYDLSSKYSLNIGKVSGINLGKVNKVITSVTSSGALLEEISDYAEGDSAVYDCGSGSCYFNEEEVAIESILRDFNDSLTDYFWMYEENNFLFSRYDAVDEINNDIKSFSFSASVNAIALHDTGISGDTVYINDLKSDYNNFIGLDYTDYTHSGSFPTGNRQNIYNDSNLVKVYIQYNGQSLVNSSWVGYVSLSEQYSKLNYYKYYKVENGYVTFELIDNPYADRPNNKAFNGWVTTYPGATISIDVDTYVRYVKIPVTDVSKTIEITFNASWVNATTVETPFDLIYGQNYWDDKIYANLNNAGLKQIDWEYWAWESVVGLYLLADDNSLINYPDNAYDVHGNDIGGDGCPKKGWWDLVPECPAGSYYTRVNSGSYDSGKTYYKLNGTMQRYNPVGYYTTNGVLNYGQSTAGLYTPVTVGYGYYLNGYYNASGTQLSGVCTTSGGCAAYELLQYYDGNGNPNVVTSRKNYYYLVTRDTNIVVITRNMQDKITNPKPMTLTCINNGTDHDKKMELDGALAVSNFQPAADLRVEHMLLETDTLISNTSNDGPPTTDGQSTLESEGADESIWGNFHNLKIGRGIELVNSNLKFVNVLGIMGGSNGSTGSASSPTRYRLIVESGYYNFISIANGAAQNSNEVDNLYVEGTGIYGCDIDRAAGNNTNLRVYFSAAANWGSKINNLPNTSKPAITTIVKSGSFGTGYSSASGTDTSGPHTFGIYAGGRGVKTALNYAPRSIIVEGGWIHALNGGPLTPDTKTSNDTYMNIKGGNIDILFGGAGTSATYGNRIINMTGGSVNYSVFGGSNSYSGSDGDGTLNGSAFLYIGGNAVVGNASNVNNNATLYGAEAGSVFGIGNGKSGSSAMGSANGSFVIIDKSLYNNEGATVRRNVYGGGNYGAVGVNTTSSSSSIKVLGGSIAGNVYGGGNNNGAGDSNSTSNVSILMSGGTAKNIYGGCKTKGTIFGNSTINFSGGTLSENIYGGGEGGYSSSSSPGTFVSGNVNVSMSGGSVSNVYGGSAYGTVNGTESNNTANNSASTNVTIGGGTVTGSVYGGGRGSSSLIPYVKGVVNVTVNSGTISGSVFGGNNQSGSTSSSNYVYLNGGSVGSAYGGGNNTGQPTTNIYLQGATVGYLYGGSNQAGTVNNSNVSVTSGTINNDLYGGNNTGGSTTTTNVTLSGGTIKGSVFGGGNKASSTTTNISLAGSTINGSAYGGGNQAAVTTTNVSLTGGSIGSAVYGGCLSSNVTTAANVVVNSSSNFSNLSIFGGSNTNGTVVKSNINFINGTVLNVYGGNNKGGTTTTTQIDVSGGRITSLFGGGNEVSSTTSTINVKDGSLTNVYGGGNKAGVTTSNINFTKGSASSVYGGSNESGNVTTANVSIGNVKTTTSAEADGIYISYLYGGNNQGGVTTNANINIKSGSIATVYGGGNKADGVSNVNLKATNCILENVFGGGNQDAVSRNVLVDIDYAQIKVNVYGGGNSGRVDGSTDVYITNTDVAGSVYGGGNGRDAVVAVDTNVTLDGNTLVGSGLGNSKSLVSGSVFGAGNAAATGSASSGGSKSTVNIVGAHIYGNVYGAANTSVVYGSSYTNIGTAVVSKNNLIEADVIIDGTVFGGGEANASGSEIYDYSFICVTTAIDVNINGAGYLNNGHRFAIAGSIFGSGNASSSEGTSDIYIANLGTRDTPSRNISIQRAQNVVIDNSVIELKGTTDRTNEYSTILYSLNRIDSLNIKNNTVLLLQQNANLLKEFKSTVDVDGREVKASVNINDKNKTVTKNVDNRLYVFANKNLNVTTNESATAYGKVSGMTFFGMYASYANGNFWYGVYDDDITYGDSADVTDVVVGGSYVLGLHSLGHDITKDGFYSNYLSEDYSVVSTAYIDPVPPDANYYMWTIGIQAVNYSFALNASKYASLGTYELSLRDFSDGNMTFNVIGFNADGLGDEVDLIDPALVPKVTDNEEDANRILGLAMKSETREWTSYGTTKFYDNGSGSYDGDLSYVTDSQTIAPSLMFYLYHAKNISLDEDIGTVIITLQAVKQISEIEYETNLITITIDITASAYDDADAYDASITYDKKYEMPLATTINITNRSQFTAYFSTIAYAEKFEDFYGIDNSNYHTLVTNYALPIGTQITMIDLSINGATPKYYYYTVDEENYGKALAELESDNEISYRLSDFIKMGSVDKQNTYRDSDSNQEYYDDTYNRTIEEFLFIFDFKDTDSVGTDLANYVLFELRNSEDRALVSVLGIRQNVMTFNLYDTSNVVLNETVTTESDYLYYDVETEFDLTTAISYNQTENREAIINTNYESSSMGLNVTFVDAASNQISSSLLSGTSLVIDDNVYHADSDGVFRIKLAGKVSNLNKKIILKTDEMLPPGNYSLRFVLFASSDGLHNSGFLESEVVDIPLTVVGSNNSIFVTSEDKDKIVLADTGKNLQNSTYNRYRVTYESVLNNPNVRFSVYKRSTDTVDSTSYNEIDVNSIFTNKFNELSERGLVATSEYEKLLNVNKNGTDFNFQFTDNLSSGTYRLVFKLYDGNQFIDEVYKYVIVKRNLE